MPSYILKLLALSLCRSHGPSLLEALPAKHRASLRWPEGHRRFLPALRTIRLGLRTHLRTAPATASSTLGTLRFATLTSLRFVLESFIGEKHLFAGRKYKLRAALRTLQYSVVEFHEPFSPRAASGKRLGALRISEPDCVGKPVSGEAGCGSLGPASAKLEDNPNISTLRGLILGSAAPSLSEKRGAAFFRLPRHLIRFPPLLLAQSLPRKRFFRPALLAGFHVEAMLLDFLDDVFLLHLALKTPQGIFQGFTLLNDDFSHFINSPPIRFGLVSCGASPRPFYGRLFASAGSAPGEDYRTRPLASSNQLQASKSRNLSVWAPPSGYSPHPVII